MSDMSSVIEPKVDQLTADHLLGGPRTLRITDVAIRPGTEQPVTISYADDNGLPWRPCKSMSRVLVKAWGPDANTYKGRCVTVYRDDKVKWGGLEVGGIRISHLTHIERDLVLALTEKKGSKKPFIVKPLKIDAPAEDKVTPGVNALVARIDAAANAAALEDITGNADVIKQRAWLVKNRPELATKIDDAVSARLADFDGAPADDGFPGDTIDGSAK